MNEIEQTAADYLKQPYSRVVIPDEESGTYTGQILEFPGCFSEGNSAQEAYDRLEEAALSWLQAALDLGQEIPPPALVHDYGGRVALRLPKSLHRQAAIAAERDGTSLNQFMVATIAEKVGGTNLCSDLIDRLEHRLFQTSVTEAVRTIIANIRIDEEANTLENPSHEILVAYQ